MSNYSFDLQAGKTLELFTAGKYCDRNIVVNAVGGGTATGGVTVYTNPTDPVPIKTGSQVVFYVNQSGTVTLTIGNATHTVDFSDTTKSEWLLWVQSTNSGGSIITPTGTRKWMPVGGTAENILFSYSGSGELVVAVME